MRIETFFVSEWKSLSYERKWKPKICRFLNVIPFFPSTKALRVACRNWMKFFIDFISTFRSEIPKIYFATRHQHESFSLPKDSICFEHHERSHQLIFWKFGIWNFNHFLYAFDSTGLLVLKTRQFVKCSMLWSEKFLFNFIKFLSKWDTAMSENEWKEASISTHFNYYVEMMNRKSCLIHLALLFKNPWQTLLHSTSFVWSSWLFLSM